MKITVDTNVLLRVAVGDDETQQQMAIQTLEGTDLVAISVHALCEFAWVLDRGYKTSRADIATSIRRLLDLRNVVVNRPAVAAGLGILDAGGDFASVIAYDGEWLGGETFVSFDKRAVSLIARQGQPSRLLA